MSFWPREKKPHSLFGLELRLNPKLRDELLNDPFCAGLKINKEFLNSLEDGDWDQIPYAKLFGMMAKAKQLNIDCFIVESIGLWSTFHDGKSNRLIIGQSKNGAFVPADFKCAEPFVEAFEPKYDPTAVFGEDEVKRSMTTENVIMIGGSKVNNATRIALHEFQKLAGQEIRFGWPEYEPKSELEERAPDSRRYLRIGAKKFVEGFDRTPPFYGLIAACRNPMGKHKDVTTVVIAGCSRDATRLMAEEIQKPSFGRQYHERWAAMMEGKPVFFVFEMKNDRPSWKMLSSIRKPKRKTGRPRRRA